MDCMEYMATVPDKWFDLAVVDPPYGIKRFEKPSGTTRFKSSKMMQEDGLTWDVRPTQEYWNELFRVSENQIVFGANNFPMPPSEYFLVWDKQQTVDNFSSAEYAWVSMGLKKPAKVFRYSIHLNNQTEKFHPTQKPTKLYQWIYSNYLPQGGKVIDTHLGSGSNRIAADKAGNIDFYATEIDKDYFHAQEKRWRDYKAQAVLTFPERIDPVQSELF